MSDRDRNYHYKTLGFHKQDDADLLQWCLCQPEDFTGFVKRILRQAMEAAEDAGQTSPTLDLAAIERAAERGAARALASVQLTTSMPAQTPAEPAIDAELEANLANLF